MTSAAKLALVLWTVFGLAVFSVTFDWQTRRAGWEFVRQQVDRRDNGLPLETIESGFRPMVRAAARQSSIWLLVIVAGGTSAIVVASRRESKDSF